MYISVQAKPIFQSNLNLLRANAKYKPKRVESSDTAEYVRPLELNVIWKLERGEKINKSYENRLEEFNRGLFVCFSSIAYPILALHLWQIIGFDEPRQTETQ